MKKNLFTFVELAIVSGTAALLMSLIGATVADMKNDAKVIACASVMKGIEEKTTKFENDNGGTLISANRMNKLWGAQLTNGRYFGGGMKIAPDQDRLDPDGKITFLIAHDLSRPRIVPIFPEIFKGTHVRHTKYIEIVKCDEVTVRFDRPCAVQIDGESIPNVTEYTAYSRNASKARNA